MKNFGGNVRLDGLLDLFIQLPHELVGNDERGVESADFGKERFKKCRLPRVGIHRPQRPPVLRSALESRACPKMASAIWAVK